MHSLCLSRQSETVITGRITYQIVQLSLKEQWKIYENFILEMELIFTAVTMKDAVFWDIKTPFVLHRRHITSPLQRPAG
jgi:hypothetical protein